MQDGEGPFAFRPHDNPEFVPRTRKAYEELLRRKELEAEAERNTPTFDFYHKRGELDTMRAAREAALAKAQGINPVFPSREVGAPQPQPLSGRDIPGAVEAVSQYQPPTRLAPVDDVGRGANAPGANAPDTPIGLTPVTTDYASLNMPTDRRATPPSAGVSGLPAMPNLRPSGGGIASLPKPEKDSSYEDYMKQANALIAEAGGDPKADKDRSFNSALMKLGLGMAASKNQSLLGAVAEGGLPALEQYTADEAQRRKDARALAGEKLTVLGSGMQMRQNAEKDYRDQLNKVEELRQRGMESEARMLEAEATARFRSAEIGLREAELGSAREERDLTRAHQDRVLQATIDNNRATLEKEPDAVRTLKAQYGDKWTVALEVQTLQDNLTEYKGLAQANLNANQMEEAKKYNSFADAAAKRLEDAMGRLYGSGNTGSTGAQVRRVDANGNPIQ
jgi:hypothetical protein